jgi:hypothetical protein
MMDTKNTIEKNKLDRIKIIFDDDIRIIDFLSDLIDRSIVRSLDRFVIDSKGMPGIFLTNCPFDSLVVLILYKSPFDFNNKDNNFIMYAHNDLQSMIKYFKKILGETSPETKEIYEAVRDITNLLCWEWCKLEEDSNTSCNHMG